MRTVLLRNTGAALSPFNAFLFLQGLETLPLRMERHSQNALAVAKHLEAPRRRRRGSTTRASRRARTTRSPSGSSRAATAALVTFGIEGGRDAGRTFIEALELFSHLANIGDAKSLAIHNASTTHSQLNDEELAAAGVTQDTVRLSVGIEHIDDILADLDQALAKARAGHSLSVGRRPRARSASSRRSGSSSSRATTRSCSTRARRLGAGRGRLRDLRRADAGDASNAVFVCHALTGDAHAAGPPRRPGGAAGGTT